MDTAIHGHGAGDAHASYDKAYWKVFAALAVFTVVELALPTALGGLRPLMIVTLMVVATVKAVLVAIYYMHLKFEQLAVGIMAAAPLILVAILILLIMADVTSVDQAGWTFTQTAGVDAVGH